MAYPKLELKIEHSDSVHISINDKVIDRLVLSSQQDQFVLLYNNHFTVIKNGDRFRLADYLITPLIVNQAEPFKKNTITSTEFKSNRDDVLAFLFQNGSSCTALEQEEGSILEDDPGLENFNTQPTSRVESPHSFKETSKLLKFPLIYNFIKKFSKHT